MLVRPAMKIWQPFAHGMRALWRGVRFFGAQRSLWPLAIAPWIIQLVCFAVASSLYVEYGDALLAQLSGGFPLYDVPDGSGAIVALLLNTFMGFLNFTIKIVISIIALFVILFCGFVIGLLLSAPFHDIISSRTEQLLRGELVATANAQSMLKAAGIALWHELQKVVLFAGIPVLAYILNVFPVVGSVLAAFVIGIYEMFVTGFSFIDYTLSRREATLRERLRFARQHIGSLLGFGVTFWIPGCLFFGTPLLVVAGTLLHHELEGSEPTS